MNTRLLPLANKIIKRLVAGGSSVDAAKELYDGKDYLEAYSHDTDINVESDPRSAIGGMWEELGRLQFKFLVDKGLQPHHKLLDIGCGSLRGGRYFIRYLQTGNYSGMDISSKAIEHGKQLVQQEALSDKNPRLLVSKNKDLKFREFAGETFDYVLAQSVFTHLKPEHIQECFENIGQIMHGHSVFYFTHFLSDEHKQISNKGFCFCQPLSFFESLAQQQGFKLRDCSDQYNHPRKQRMIELMKK